MRFLTHLHVNVSRFYRAHADRVRATVRDRRLADRLRVAFERDLQLAGVTGLHFYAYKGMVTVYGTVRHELDRDLIVNFIRQIQGVREVVEHLRVEASVPLEVESSAGER